MLQALPVKLETNDDEKALLIATMKQYNEAANFLTEQAFRLKLANKVELQKRFYRQLREQFNLSAQFAIRVISKVVEAYKRDRSINLFSGSLEQSSTTSATSHGKAWTECL